MSVQIKISWILRIGLLVVLSAPGCRKEPTRPAAGQTADQRAATLASLKKVDSFPLYSMIYYGDYGFDQMLETGIVSGELRSGEEDWACSCFAALGSGSDPVYGRNFD